MPRGITERVKERKKAVLEILADGCKTTAHVMRELGLNHSEAFYVLKVLALEGYIKRVLIGGTAIWCLGNEDYEKLVNTLQQEIRRIIESHKLKYVSPSRLYRLIQEDPHAYKLISQYVPMNYSNSIALRFLSHLLYLMYGPPYDRGVKTVYLAIERRRKPAV